MNPVALLCAEFHIREDYIKNIIALLDEGCTIPFIARYRKEAHGTTDDQTLRAVADRLEYLRGLDKRREEIRKSVAEQDKLTDELSAALDRAVTLAELEDLYRPYKPKRRTRATIAREKGLEPLARLILEQTVKTGTAQQLAEPYIDPQKGVKTAEEALAGACDILAEEFSDDAELRRQLRAYCTAYGLLSSKAVKQEDSVYAMYYDYKEPVSKIQSHRILAINRGEKEEFLKVSLLVDSAVTINILRRRYVKEGSVTSQLVADTCLDAYERLLFASLEREIRAELTQKASEQAISVFASNLKQLLMQPPVRGKVTLGIDPAYRTGCKFAVVDKTGKVLEKGVIYPTPPQNKIAEAQTVVTRLIDRYGITAISIGNGTASKETEMFVSQLLHTIQKPVAYMVVSEAGASVYSASKLAAEEFPDYDVSLRSAVSIARRLQDPLAELVKIDPKSIGVGQYQHDMPPARLDSALDGVVEDCVNSVGVELNTASASLLSHVAGLSGTVAKNIVAFREENGAFTARSQLKKVAKLGPKAFEQCAGFLRIADAENILDNTGVHPESYTAAQSLLKLFGFTDGDVRTGNLGDLPQKLAQFGEEAAAEHCGVGVPTLRDIVRELQRPGRDPRDELPPPLLRTDVLEMKDLQRGMELQGTVRNCADFGVFVDIGVHQDGLVHISQICDRFIRHPLEAVKVGDIVTVWVLDVDPVKKRISLTMKRPASPTQKKEGN